MNRNSANTKTKKSKRVAVLGHRGMLGWMVQSLLEESFEVVVLEDRFDPAHPELFLNALNARLPDVVVNCIGAIPQRTPNLSDLLTLNSYFPVVLRRSLSESVLIIHPSTDCVFDGQAGPYKSDALHTATDPYGISKSLGERVAQFPSTVVIRASIIGPEPTGRNAGLFGWFVNQRTGVTVNGYANHYWNGITTLKWAETAAKIVSDGLPSEFGPIIQLGTVDFHSKLDILNMLAERFRPDLTVQQHCTAVAVNRVLVPNIAVATLDSQLNRLQQYMQTRIVAA